MKARMRPSPAVKVAAVATAVLAVVYVAAVIVLNLLVGAHLTGQSDARLADRLSDVRRDPSQLTQPASGPGGRGEPDDLDADSAPVYLWAVNAGGTVTAHSPGAPSLPASLFRGILLASSGPRRACADGRPRPPGRAVPAEDGPERQRLAGRRPEPGRRRSHPEPAAQDAELIAGPFVLAAMFLASLVVGLRALAPVEQSRRRQLEFTADASHELRTPLAVIRAEADVALAAPRDADGYRDAPHPDPGREPAAAPAGRGHALASPVRLPAAAPGRRAGRPGHTGPGLRGSVPQSSVPAVTADTPDTPVLISAPPEWIDRLAGVLVDNACRYAGPGGQVRIGVLAQGSRVSLIVEDSGPGIPAAERSRLFDRFHRATEHGSGDRPRPGHRRLDRPLHRRPLAGRRFRPRWRPDVGLLAARPAPRRSTGRTECRTRRRESPPRRGHMKLRAASPASARPVAPRQN